MNSLINKSFRDIYSAQFKLKIHMYLDMLLYLVILQIIAEVLFFYIDGILKSGSAPLVKLEYHAFTPIFVLFFSAIWSFYMGILVTKKQQRLEMASFIVTRKMEHTTNISLFLCFSIFASLTTMLLNYVTRIVLLLYNSTGVIDESNLLHAPRVFFVSLIFAILCLLFTSAIGYFLGLLAYKYKFVYTLFFAAICAFLFWLQKQDAEVVYEKLNNPSLLFGSICIAITLLFGISTRFSTALEVR
ncbi:hypothetical protein [Rummeliibacillus pycnus]|uniref:hypothetical protein n=1 Tax=Rummeliibacillus pycnus TaxID=101070 RepID=UPI0037CB208D